MTDSIPDLGIANVSVGRVETDVGDYVVDFYARDVRPKTVRAAIKERGFEVTKREQSEGGNLHSLFIEKGGE